MSLDATCCDGHTEINTPDMILAIEETEPEKRVNARMSAI